MELAQAGGKKTKRPVQVKDGNWAWTEGDLIIETVGRFKGQSAPVVVFCEIDFEELSQTNARKLFVGMTRGQMKVELVISERTAALLSANPNQLIVHWICWQVDQYAVKYALALSKKIDN